MLLFHHDPRHDDGRLDALGVEAAERWAALGGDPDRLSLAVERQELSLVGGAAASLPAGA